MTLSDEPITNCPVCRYDLTGLPKNHTCPECGFEYDDTMRVWVGPKPGWTVRVISSVPHVLFLGMFIYVGTMVRIPAYVYAIVCLGGLLVPTILLVLTILDRRRRAFMIVSDNGLLLGDARKSEFTRWNELIVPPPSDLWLRRPIYSAPMGKKEQIQSWLFLRVFTRDLGGFNFHRTIFKKGAYQKPLRLQFGSCNGKARRVAYENLYKRWLNAQTANALKT